MDSAVQSKIKSIIQFIVKSIVQSRVQVLYLPFPTLDARGLGTRVLHVNDHAASHLKYRCYVNNKSYIQ